MRANDGLKKAIAKKIVYKHYLESVVNETCNSFLSVTELMKRCESLVASRDKLKAHLAIINEKSKNEAADLDKFQEDRMVL